MSARPSDEGASRSIHLVTGGSEIARRRARLPAGTLVEAWQDLHEPDHFWLGDESKAAVGSVGDRLPGKLAVDASRVSIYYGPRLIDTEPLPSEESLKARVLSAHGIAAAWITIDARGQRVTPGTASADDPVFFLRRSRGSTAHVWRLLRSRAEAIASVAEEFTGDPEADGCARAIPVSGFDELIERYAR